MLKTSMLLNVHTRSDALFAIGPFNKNNYHLITVCIYSQSLEMYIVDS